MNLKEMINFLKGSFQKEKYSNLLSLEINLSRRVGGRDDDEIKRQIVLTNIAQNQVLEEEIGHDIDGDGKIGKKMMCILCKNMATNGNVCDKCYDKLNGRAA